MDTCINLEFSRRLADLSSGAIAEQYVYGEHTMTLTYHGDDYIELKGKSFVTLERMNVIIDEDEWSGVFGHMLLIEGGTELDVDGERLERMLEDYSFERDGDLSDDWLPVTINDIYLPRLKGLVPWRKLASAMNETTKGEGVRATGNRVECNANCGVCLPCYYKSWTKRAFEKGMMIGT